MKVTKKLLAIAMAATMVFSTSAMTMTASAAKWITTDNGVKYQYDNGSYAKSKWLKTSSGKYYIKSNGTRATGWLTLKSNGTSYKYYFNSKGVMQTGWQTIDGNTYYFNTTSGKMTANKKIVIGSYSYKFDKNGKWTGIVYSKDGKKNVTKSVNVEKLTGQSSTTTSTSTTKTTTDKSTAKKVSGEVPATVTINGQVLNTSATNTYVGKKADAIYPKGKDVNSRYTCGGMWAIDISGCTDKDLEVLKYFSNLEKLTLVDWENTSKVTNLDFCQYMPKLSIIYVQGAINLTDVSGLGACKNLQYIEISHCKLTNLDGLESLKNVKEVDIAYTWLDNLDGLVNCTKLEEVTVYCGRLTDISALANKSKLTFVELNINRRLKDITALTKCANLEELYLNGCTSVNTWEALKSIPKLDYVALKFNVIGSKGPHEVGEWLANNGVGVAYGDSNKLWSGTHPSTKEKAVTKAWDAKYRPSKVDGDEVKCGAGCEDCKYTKNAMSVLD